MSTGKNYDCIWPTGCANSSRCIKASMCIARWQAANKDKLFPDGPLTVEEDVKIIEDPMKTLIREVIAEGREKREFKQSVRKHLIKTGTGNREVISMRIRESHKRIDRYWRQIEAEEGIS